MRSRKLLEDSASTQPVPAYYKDPSWLSSRLYVQEKWGWRSYALDATRLGRGVGLIPRSVRTRLVRIDEAEAEKLVPSSLRTKPPKALRTQDKKASSSEPLPPGVYEFTPRRWRYFVWGLLPVVAVFAVAVAVAGWTCYGRSSFYWALGGALLYGLALAFWELQQSRQTLAIRVDGGVLLGPGGRRKWQRTRRQIPLYLLHHQRSARRSLVDLLLGRQYFYADDGTAIYFARRFFASADVRALLGLAGLGR